MASGSEDDEDLALMLNAAVACEKSLPQEPEKKEVQNENSKNTDDVLAGGRLENDESPSKSLTEKYDKLEQRSKINREKLRKLKLVKTYQEKNNLKTLENLIAKWRKASQSALMELLHFAPKEQPTTLGQLITYLGIDFQTIQFDSEKQAFVSNVKQTTCAE